MSDPRDETICDVSATLLQLLKGTLGPANVALGPPKNASTLLTLFLYRVMENPYLRNDARRPLPTGIDGRLLEEEPPLILDLYYLLTAHHSTDQLEAHRGLSRAMRVFYDNAVLRGSEIQATKDRGLPPDTTLRITLDPLSMEEMTRIWGVFPDTQYAISVTYLVTPVPVQSVRTLGSAPVVDQIHRQGHLQRTGAGAQR